MAVYVPKSLAPDHTAPMIAIFRPSGPAPREYLDYLQLIDVAEEHGVLLVLPEGKLATFPFGPTWQRPAIDGAWDAIRGLRDELCADATQFYLLGEGNGGEVVDMLVCRHGRTITAAATTGHRYRTDERMCVPDTPVPYLHFEHLRTSMLPVQGGTECPGAKPAYSLADQRAIYLENHGCGPDEPRVTKHRDGRCLEFACTTPFMSCEVAGGRHWNGPLPAEYRQKPCAGKRTKFPYLDVMWTFFMSHGANR